MSFLRGVVRSTNPEFEQFANQLRALLIIPGGRELALWSGGIDLSIFSYEKSRCPLEQTVLGKLLNTMPITTLWNLEAPLWNITSRTFEMCIRDRYYIMNKLLRYSGVYEA